MLSIGGSWTKLVIAVLSTLTIVLIFQEKRLRQQENLEAKIKQVSRKIVLNNESKLLESNNNRKRSKILNEEELKIKAQLVTVRVFSTGNRGGSGVIIGKHNDVYFVITNNHVVDDTKINYQIQTPTNKIYPAKVIWQNNQDAIVDDLALLKFSSKEKYEIVKVNNSFSIQTNEIVIASGFSFQENLKQSEKIKYTVGYVKKILSQPLIGGYQLGYTNTVHTGMSGGSILNQKGELIGINGLGKYPFLGNPYIYQNGTDIPESELKIMSQLSWGIPSQSINELISKLKQNKAVNF
jgi:S1-C subfamily serine protease